MDALHLIWTFCTSEKSKYNQMPKPCSTAAGSLPAQPYLKSCQHSHIRGDWNLYKLWRTKSTVTFRKSPCRAQWDGDDKIMLFLRPDPCTLVRWLEMVVKIWSACRDPDTSPELLLKEQYSDPLKPIVYMTHKVLSSNWKNIPILSNQSVYMTHTHYNIHLTQVVVLPSVLIL